MMKSKDCATATALIIQGFLHANEVGQCGEADCFADNNRQLAECLSAIRLECHDWAENLPVPAPDPNAIEPDLLEVDLQVRSAAVDRSPYNLISAAISLYREAVDLAGPEAVLSDFRERLSKARSSKKPVPPRDGGDVFTIVEKPEIAVLIEAADSLVAEIDAAEERPVQKLALWDIATEKLRSLGVVVEDRCLAPSQW